MARTEEEWLTRHGEHLRKTQADVARWLESETDPDVRRDLLSLAQAVNALGDAIDVAWLAENEIGEQAEPAKKRSLWRRWKKEN